MNTPKIVVLSWDRELAKLIAIMLSRLSFDFQVVYDIWSVDEDFNGILIYRFSSSSPVTMEHVVKYTPMASIIFIKQELDGTEPDNALVLTLPFTFVQLKQMIERAI